MALNAFPWTPLRLMWSQSDIFKWSFMFNRWLKKKAGNRNRNHCFWFPFGFHSKLQSHSSAPVRYNDQRCLWLRSQHAGRAYIYIYIHIYIYISTRIPPSALNHNLPLEFISHQTSNSSTQSNKKLNPATHSWEVKPSLSSDSSGREGWRSCAKSNQACSQAASDSYWHLFLEISSAILFEPRGSTSFGTLNSSWCSLPEKFNVWHHLSPPYLSGKNAVGSSLKVLFVRSRFFGSHSQLSDAETSEWPHDWFHTFPKRQ